MKKFTLSIYIGLCAYVSIAQSSLQGVVTDEENAPLTGAHVLVKETGAGQITDANGKFQVANLKPGIYTVVLSFIGYETKNEIITVEGATRISIALTPGAIQLSDVVVTSAPDRPVNTLSQVDIKLRPVNTSQDVLRMVPGLFIAQHAGGGKAEQIFLRGFDCDHGTDIAVDMDGVPMNMVSHAHGQGYADLHFLMPEMISFADFDKGPYFAHKGDLNTAGYVSFQTKRQLERNFVKLEAGSFNTGRVAAGVKVLDTKKSNAFIASEYFKSDGFFVNNQDFTRFNLHSRFNTQLSSHTQLSAVFTAFSSGWNASGQIPDRAVDEGIISRFGSIDPTEGGNTSRLNAYVKLWHDLKNGGSWETQLYAVHYDFSLFSNFTFFLHDPVNGDQINQKDNRWMYGYLTRYQQGGTLFGKKWKTDLGAGGRFDNIGDVELNHTAKRAFLAHTAFGSARELNMNAFASGTLFLTDQFSVNAALRLDYFHFNYNNHLTVTQQPAVGTAIVSPKLNFNYQVNPNVSLFVRSGTGFHSNDVRVVVAQDGKDILPRAYSVDAGANVKITPRLLLHTALWRMNLDQEFVYVGDEGVVEPSGKTTREGIDISVRAQLNAWLFADVDANFTRPRLANVPEGQNYIPLAPVVTNAGGLSVRRSSGLSGSLRYRYLSDRPANEDNSLVAKGYFINDVIVNYTQRSWELGLSAENIFDVQWKEAQFDTLSRLKNEAAPVEEIHFTPGTPFALRLRVTKYF
jgi:outer membrane receptor protein involved in Fe transport